MAAPLYGCFAIGGVFFSDVCLAVCGSLADALSPLARLAPFLVDALLPRVCRPTSWLMLCRRGRLVFVGGCFAAVAAGCSYVLSGWMLSHYSFVYLVGNPGLLFLLQAQL